MNNGLNDLLVSILLPIVALTLLAFFRLMILGY